MLDFNKFREIVSSPTFSHTRTRLGIVSFYLKDKSSPTGVFSAGCMMPDEFVEFQNYMNSMGAKMVSPPLPPGIQP